MAVEWKSDLKLRKDLKSDFFVAIFVYDCFRYYRQIQLSTRQNIFVPECPYSKALMNYKVLILFLSPIKTI